LKYSNNSPTDEFVGHWRDDERDGWGKETFKDGSIHEALYHAASKSTSNDKHTFANGDCYEGEWRDGRMNGAGKFTPAGKSMHQGYWKDGEEIDKAVYDSLQHDLQVKEEREQTKKALVAPLKGSAKVAVKQTKKALVGSAKVAANEVEGNSPK
jgi:hypothetical protein